MSRTEKRLPTHSEKAIYTLVQSGTQPQSKTTRNALVSGKGTELNNNPSLVNRAKRKTITRTTTLSFVDIANSKGDHERAQKYWNTYHCQNKVIISGGKPRLI